MDDLQRQIIFAVKDWFATCLEVNEPFLPEHRIDEFLKKVGWWDELDLDHLARFLDQAFGCTYSLNDWRVHFGCDLPSAKEWERCKGPDFTFASLAAFVAARAQPVTLEPTTVLGRACPTAGVFVAVEKIVTGIRGSEIPFGPSTTLSAVLGPSQQCWLWQRLRYLTQGRLPEVTGHSRATTAQRLGLVTFCSAAAVLVGMLLCASPHTVFFSIPAGLAVFAFLFISIQLPSPRPPLHIVTFRGLAEEVVRVTAGGVE